MDSLGSAWWPDRWQAGLTHKRNRRSVPLRAISPPWHRRLCRSAVQLDQFRNIRASLSTNRRNSSRVTSSGGSGSWIQSCGIGEVHHKGSKSPPLCRAIFAALRPAILRRILPQSSSCRGRVFPREDRPGNRLSGKDLACGGDSCAQQPSLNW